METSSIFKENSIQLQEYFTYETWSIKRKKKKRIKDISTNWFENHLEIQSNREYREQKTKKRFIRR